MTSIPSGSFGNMIPQSTTAIRPSHSTAMQFIPISPRPPSGTMRTGGATGRMYSREAAVAGVPRRNHAKTWTGRGRLVEVEDQDQDQVQVQDQDQVVSNADRSRED